MRYSLSSRFRGVLLGTAASQLLGRSNWDWQRLLVPGTRSLIRLGMFESADWRQAFDNSANLVSCEAVIAILPLALFYHENEVKLRKNLQLALVAGWQHDPVSRDAALAVGYAISLCLREKLNATTLIPQAIAFLGQPQTQLAQQLLQVQAMLEQQAGLERVQAELLKSGQSTTPVAMAFYCFLSTLEDLRLSTERATQNRYQAQSTTAITGALSGAYNSTAGIPAHLRVRLSQLDPKSLAEMLDLFDSLVAVWSGVYSQSSDKLTQAVAIAAPRVIRP